MIAEHPLREKFELFDDETLRVILISVEGRAIESDEGWKRVGPYMPTTKGAVISRIIAAIVCLKGMK